MGLGNPPAGQDVIPPDTMGAAGPDHLVSILNSDFGVFDKATGAVLQSDLPAIVLGIPRDGGGAAGEFLLRPENPL